MNSFADIFHMILFRFKVFAFSHLEFQEHLLCRARLLCDCCASESANRTLWFSFIQNQQYLQGFFDISLYISLLMGCSWKQCFWAFTVTLPSVKKKPKADPAAKKLFRKKVLAKPLNNSSKSKNDWRGSKISWTARLGNCKITLF